MVRNTFNITRIGGLAVAAMSLLAPAFINHNTFATTICTTDPDTGVKTCTCDGTGSCANNGTFQVSVDEILTVNVARPTTWAEGEVDTLLTNLVPLTVSTNNVAGFQATMTTNTDYVENSATGTDLVNTDSRFSSAKIATLSAATAKSAFPTDRWGFAVLSSGSSLADSTTFSPLVAKNASAPALVSHAEEAGTVTNDIYFGAKSSSSMPSGTYAETVLISVVSGVHDSTEPTTPDNPSTPTPSDPAEPDEPQVAYNNNGTAGTATGRTVYTNNYNSGTGSTATENTYSEVTRGNNTSNYSGYAYPQGETNTVATINEGTPLATGLAVTAAVAATAGVVFFILAKRKKDDDDEEEC
ncbi:hypothetical protein IJ118_03250 [Candidatus Saccharibacteria bacterium]|nr:hypothetical protein [Candidatus Saccharibacteria bacterium]